MHFFGRFGRGTLVHGMALDWAVGVFVFLEIDALFEVFKEADDAGSQQSRVREVPQSEFGEESDSLAAHFEGAHSLSADKVDLNINVMALGLDRLP